MWHSPDRCRHPFLTFSCSQQKFDPCKTFYGSAIVKTSLILTFSKIVYVCENKITVIHAAFCTVYHNWLLQIFTKETFYFPNFSKIFPESKNNKLHKICIFLKAWKVSVENYFNDSYSTSKIKGEWKSQVTCFCILLICNFCQGYKDIQAEIISLFTGNYILFITQIRVKHLHHKYVTSKLKYHSYSMPRSKCPVMWMKNKNINEKENQGS